MLNSLVGIRFHGRYTYVLLQKTGVRNKIPSSKTNAELFKSFPNHYLFIVRQFRMYNQCLEMEEVKVTVAV